MAFAKISLNNFKKGISTAFGRIAQPGGSMTRLSNLAYFRTETGIGSLVTWGGCGISSALASGNNQAPFFYIAAFTPETGGITRIAIQVTGGGGSGTNLVSVTPNPWGPSVININGQTSFKTVQALMFDNYLVIATGLSNPPALWNGTTVANVTNAWTGAGYVPTWLANTGYAVGSFVQPDISNGNFYEAIQGGTSGGSEPTFPTGTGATVPDGTIIWQQAGVTTAGVPNAAHIANHQGSLWAWGTNTTTGSQFGPSGLAASDVGNPNSWNPANQTFVGAGDGQQAQGCSPMAVEEVGVAPEARLILFKDFSTYEFLGNFPNFSLVQAKTSVGCVTPRSIQFVPQLGGIVRFTDQGFWLYQGPGVNGDNCISTDVDAYIFGRNDVTGVDKTNWQLGQSALTKDFYMCAMPISGGNGRLARIFIFDLNLKVWSICDLPSGILLSSFNSIRQFSGDTLVLGTQVQQGGQPNGPTVLTFGNSFAAATNEWTYEGGQNEIAWSGTTPLIVDPKKPQRVFYTRNVLIGGTSPASGAGGSSLGIGRITSASIIFNNPATGSDNGVNPAGTPQQSGTGTPETLTIPIPSGGLVLPARINIGRKTRGFQLVLGGSGIVFLESIDCEVVPREERPYAQA